MGLAIHQRLRSFSPEDIAEDDWAWKALQELYWAVFNIKKAAVFAADKVKPSC